MLDTASVIWTKERCHALETDKYERKDHKFGSEFYLQSMQLF